MIRRTLILAVAAAAVSCSVFEDRTDCPCYLVVDYAVVNNDSTRPTREGRVHSLLYNPDCSENITHMSVSCPAYDTLACKKGDALFSAIYSPGTVPLKSLERVVRYSSGNQVDSIYGCHESLLLVGEREEVKVSLHKQFSTVKLIIKDSDTIVRQADVTAVGNTCGYDLADFSPVKGDYRYAVPDDGSSERSFRIPRQADYSLVLHIANQASGLDADFPLGQYLADIGYDFDVPDLSDFEIELDISYMTFTIKINDWDREFLVNVFDYDFD